MKYLVLIPDGAADYPLKELGNKTPLQVADIPNLTKLADGSTLGLARTIPKDFPAGSDVANLSILGYDPHKYFSGRGPIEAAYHRIDFDLNDTVFRCNLITVTDGKIADYSAGHIDTQEAHQLIDSLQKQLGSKTIQFYAGVSYRHLAIFRNAQLAHLKMVAPHDVIGQEIEALWPKDKDSHLVKELTVKAAAILENHSVNEARKSRGLNPANMIWLWGSGQKKEMPSFKQRFGLSGGVISAVDLIKGLGVAAGLEVINVEGATGYYDTNYEAKAKAAIEVLKEKDFVYVHVEAPDEAGHTGNIEEKIKALENFDKRLVAHLLNDLDLRNLKVLVMPDHATPLKIKTHTRDNVPFLLYPGTSKAKGFNEEEAKRLSKEIIQGHELMPVFLKK